MAGFLGSLVSGSRRLILGFVAGSVLLAGGAKAGAIYTFAYTDGANEASGTLVADALSDGQWHLTAGSISVFGLSAGVWTLYPAGPSPVSIGGDVYIVNNIIYPGSVSPFDTVVDDYGLLFRRGDDFLNFYSTASSLYASSQYDGESQSYVYTFVDISPDSVILALAPSPLPFLGLAQAFLVSRRIRRRFARSSGLSGRETLPNQSEQGG
ncbi:MAG: hypothetical protein VKJ05_02970 [Synechococcaceae cyanobacterium]|nr:hypothetical protein [Synechococcaceae cyanobacterium]